MSTQEQCKVERLTEIVVFNILKGIFSFTITEIGNTYRLPQPSAYVGQFHKNHTVILL